MIKLVVLIVRNPDLTPQQFRNYWEEIHVPLIRERLPGLVKYTGGFAVDAPGVVDPVNVLDGYDAVVELGFPDLETMQRDMTSPEFLADERGASSAALMVVSKTRAMVVDELDLS